MLPTKMTYGNLFIFVFMESHSGWPKGQPGKVANPARRQLNRE